MTDSKKSGFKKFIVVAVTLLLLLAAVGAVVGWYKFFREEPQPDWITSDPDMRFKYGSIGAEHDAGVPYWIWYVLPRMFPDKLPGPGGYAALGVNWEQGQEMPIGFTKKVIGFPRVANTCAACHTASYRSKPDENPTFVVTGPNHTLDLQNFFRFLIDCAKDPRFNSDNLMREINLVTDLSWLDRVIYRFILIPITKKRLLEREEQFAWLYRKDFPEWGRGRDDAMNLTKYFMIEVPMDDSIGPTDMPSVWNLKKYTPDEMVMNLAGDSHNARSVIIDSALGLLGAAPKDKEDFLGHIDWLEEYLGNYPPPKYPFPIDESKVMLGKSIFDQTCARCHGPGQKNGTRLPVNEVGTDPERLGTWNKEAAIEANRVVTDMGIERKGLVEETLDGYVVSFLDGIWLRAPYLHNGSVPTLRDLLEPIPNRPKVFYRGYDVYDQKRVGFVTTGAEAQRVGTKFDVSERGSGNQGHEYGISLSPQNKEALVEYLKTL